MQRERIHRKRMVDMEVTRSCTCKITFTVRATVNHSFNTVTQYIEQTSEDRQQHYQYAKTLRNLLWEVAGIMKQNETILKNRVDQKPFESTPLSLTLAMILGSQESQ